MHHGAIAKLDLNRVSNWSVFQHRGDHLQEGRRIAGLVVGRQGRNDTNFQGKILRREKTATALRLAKLVPILLLLYISFEHSA